ncbi:hypothetical protein Tco_1562784 [Tanacetum coccineum]
MQGDTYEEKEEKAPAAVHKFVGRGGVMANICDVFLRDDILDLVEAEGKMKAKGRTACPTLPQAKRLFIAFPAAVCERDSRYAPLS